MIEVSLIVFDHFPLCMFSQLLFLHLLQPLNLRGFAKKTGAGLWSCFDSIYNVKWLAVRVAGVMVLESFGSHLHCRFHRHWSHPPMTPGRCWVTSSAMALQMQRLATLWDLFCYKKMELELMKCILDSCPWRLIQIDTPVYTLIPPIILKLLFSTTQCCHGKAKLCQSPLKLQRHLQWRILAKIPRTLRPYSFKV